MQITVNVDVDDVDLSTVLEGYEDEDGRYQRGTTIGQRVVYELVNRMAREGQYKGLLGRVQEIRDEQIRELLKPVLAEALAKPLRITNSFGEASGPETTLRELLLAEVKKVVSAPADRYSREKGTWLEVTIRNEVRAAFEAEVNQAVKDVKDAVAGQMGALVADAVAKAR